MKELNLQCPFYLGQGAKTSPPYICPVVPLYVLTFLLAESRRSALAYLHPRETSRPTR